MSDPTQPAAEAPPTETEALELAFEALEATREECGAWSELEERAVVAIVARLELLAAAARGPVN